MNNRGTNNEDDDGASERTSAGNSSNSSSTSNDNNNNRNGNQNSFLNAPTFNLRDLINRPHAIPPKKRKRPAVPPPPPVISEGGHAALGTPKKAPQSTASRNNASETGNNVSNSPSPPKPKKAKRNPSKPLPQLYSTPPLTGKNLKSLNMPGAKKNQAKAKPVEVEQTQTGGQTPEPLNSPIPQPLNAQIPLPLSTQIQQFFESGVSAANHNFPMPSSIARMDFSSIPVQHRLPFSMRNIVLYESDTDADGLPFENESSQSAASCQNTSASNGPGASASSSTIQMQQTAVTNGKQSSASAAETLHPPTTLPITENMANSTSSSREENGIDQAATPTVQQNVAASVPELPPPKVPASNGSISSTSIISVNSDTFCSTANKPNSNRSSVSTSTQTDDILPSDPTPPPTTAAVAQTSSSANVNLNDSGLETQSSDNSSRKSYCAISSANNSFIEDEIKIELNDSSNNKAFNLSDNDFPALSQVNMNATDDNSGMLENINEENEDFVSWRSGLNLDRRYNYFQTKCGNGPPGSYDIIFEVGPEKEKFYAHLLVLSTVSDIFKNQNNLREIIGTQAKPYKFVCAKVEPEGFRDMLDFLYLGKFRDGDVGVKRMYAILKAARKIEYTELVNFCTGYLRSSVTVDNVAENYHLSIQTGDERLREIAIRILSSQTWEVFSSGSFIRLSEDALQTLLRSDDFYLDEKSVFEAVKRWALAKHQPKHSTTEITGEMLREALGPILFCIRFPTMNLRDFFKIDRENRGLLTDTEYREISGYIGLKEDDGTDLGLSPQPCNFNCTPRPIKHSVELIKKEEKKEVKMDIDSNDDDVIEEDIIILSSSSASPCSVNSEVEVIDSEVEVVSLDGDDDDDEDETHQPETETNEEETYKEEPQFDGQQYNLSLYSLSDYVQLLQFDDEVEKLESIKTNILLSKRNPRRLFLPNLKEFNLKLYPRAQSKFGSAFKSFWKAKLSFLNEILFFDKVPQIDADDNGAGNIGTKVLENLIGLRVNVKITAPNPREDLTTCPPADSSSSDIVMLHINHDEGIFLLHLVKEAQSIINGASEFPLKLLAINECDVTSLDPFRRDLLEVIVLRRVKGLRNRGNFLKQCTKLREVCWNDMEKEEIDLHDCFWKSSRYIRKISLTKCRIVMNREDLMEPSFTEELFLDNCHWKQNFVNALPLMFPYVKRVQMYGTQNDNHLLLKVLEMPNIEWILIWQLAYKYAKLRKKKVYVMTPESRRISCFLSEILGEKAERDEVTFIIRRKPEIRNDAPGTSSALQTWNPLDSKNWTGEILQLRESFEKVSELDFVHNQYNKFFPSYEVFQWMDVTGKDYEKALKKQCAQVS